MKFRLPHFAGTRQAFTLVEMLVVISIIGILAGLLLPTLSGIKKRAQIRKAQMEIGDLVAAINQYEATYSRFPASARAVEALHPTCPDFTYGTYHWFPDNTADLVRNRKSEPLIPIQNQCSAIPHPAPPGRYETGNAELMGILLDLEVFRDGNNTVNFNHVKNPQRIKFLPNIKQVDSDNTTLPGVAGLGRDGIYRDPWGNPYIITLDLNYDNKCRDGFYRGWKVSQASGRTGFNGLYNSSTDGPATDNFEANTTVMVWSLGPDGTANTAIPANQGENKDNLLSWK